MMKPTLKADRFAILTATSDCFRCASSIQVSSLMVPSYVERDPDEDEWFPVDECALLMHVEWVDDVARMQWLDHAPWIAPSTSTTAGFTYLANVCSCGALQGDWFLTKPGAAFFPLEDVSLDAISLKWGFSSLSARAATSQSSWMDNLLARFPIPGSALPTQRTPTKRRRR